MNQEYQESVLGRPGCYSKLRLQLLENGGGVQFLQPSPCAPDQYVGNTVCELFCSQLCSSG